MSLHDLEQCACGHPRHAHTHSYVKTVIKGYEESFYGGCRNCQCKGFLSASRNSYANRGREDN